MTDLFTVDEFATYAAINVEEVDEARLRLMTRETIALVRAVVGDWPVGTTDVVQVVALRAVKRAYIREGLAGVSSQQTSAGPFSQTVTWGESAGSGGVWLSKADRLLLRTALGDGRGRAFSVNTVPVYARGSGVHSARKPFNLA